MGSASSLSFSEMWTSTYEDPTTRPSLDESLYTPDDQELAFFRSQTGIDDEQALKDHIISVQRKAYDACLIFRQDRAEELLMLLFVTDSQLPLYPKFFVYEVRLNVWRA